MSTIALPMIIMTVTVYLKLIPESWKHHVIYYYFVLIKYWRLTYNWGLLCIVGFKINVQVNMQPTFLGGTIVEQKRNILQ